MAEFVLDTRSFCFICLNRASAQDPTVKMESESDSPLTEPHSLLCLSRYLRINLGRVLHEEGSHAKLKAELCESCAHINQSFSQLYQRLEKIELEMAACISNIHSKILKANETRNAQEFFNLIDNEFSPGGEVKGKLEIAKIVRSEAVQKCSKIIKSRPPVAVLKLQRISMEQMKARQIAGLYMNSPHMTCAQDESSPQILTITKLEPVVVKPTRFICPASKRVVKKSNTRGLNGGTTKCKYCQMEFGSYSGLAYHINSVHLKKRLTCPECGKKFSQRPNFNRHRQSAHLGVTYSCVGCNQTYKYKRGLTKHQQKTGCGADFT